MVSRIVEIVSRAMSGKWRQLGYVELYAGPGRLRDQSTGLELPGSSMLKSLGFLAPGRHVVDYPAGVPYYDVLHASRHPLGVQLWDRANPSEPPEPSLLDAIWN